MTSSKSGEGSTGIGSNETSNSDGNEEEDGKSTDYAEYEPSKKGFILKSPMGTKSAEYSWPLKKGKGSLRRSEDKEDEAGEIMETIRWVGEDVPEIKLAMENSGVISKYDPKSYDSMLELCKTYNRAVDAYLKDRNSSSSDTRLTRCSKLHLKHILQKCYNKSVIDPNELNNYEAFTPEVYGETSFELICQILDKLHPIGKENKFVDLGSGVGQVVLQVAALTNCSISLGIEKSNTPAKYAEELGKRFTFWMAFYGKTYSNFKLVHGDFLQPVHRPEILESTIVFVNNFAFGPEVDQHLKDIFADLSDGSRIFSSKSFCALNFRITDRNLSDIGTIMHVSKMDPLKGSVSWTGRPVSYYLHVIDRAKLERYFQKTAARKGEKDEDGRRSGGRRRPAGNNGSSSGCGTGPPSGISSAGGLDHMGIDGESSSGWSPKSRDEDSRASSIEKDMNNINLSSDQSNCTSAAQTPSGKSSRRGGGVWTDASRGPSEDDEDGTTSSPSGIHGRQQASDKNNFPHMIGRLAKQRGKCSKRNQKKSLKRHQLIEGGLSFDEETLSHSSTALQRVHEDEEYETGEIDTPPTDSNSSSPPHQASDNSIGTPNRPIRAVVANAAAISEAQGDKALVKKRGRKRLLLSSSELKKNKLGVISRPIVNGNEDKKLANLKRTKISGLDLLHKTTMDLINASETDPTVPQGCVYERLTKNAPNKLIHEELPLSLNVEHNNPTQLPFGLQTHLERCKRQYMNFMRHMEDPVFKTRVEADITKEKQRNEELLKRERQLKSQIENLISDSLGLLKCRLNELGIQAKSPPEFIEKAKSIVCNHHELQRGKASLENEIRQLEVEQEKVIASKEKELLDKIMNSGVSYGDAKAIIQKQIEGALNGFKGGNGHNPDPKVAPFLNKLSDVTLTKCEQSLPLSTQIRKRPRDQTNRQKDWPEKRHKAFSSPNTSGTIKDTSPTKQGNWSHSEVNKIEEKNPEILAKKIMEQGRCLEKSKSSEALSVLSPRSVNNVTHGIAPSGGVEVRKLETADSHFNRSNRSPSSIQQSSALNVTSPRNTLQHQSSSNDAYTNHDRSLPVQHMTNYNRDRNLGCNINPLNDKSPTSSALVDLPKVDLKLSINNTSSDPMANSIAAAMASASRHAPALSQSHKEPPLVLPPHPTSRSHSSDGHTGEDMTFASTKVSSTPRAEQFEDRLKTIIHSVLAGDSDQREAAAAKSNQDVKPPLHILPYTSNSPPQSTSSSKPMFSPVKKELPTHLPLPPSGILGTEKSGTPNTTMSRPQQPYYTSGSSQTLTQHVSTSAAQAVVHSAYAHPSNLHMSRQGSHTGEEAGSSMIKAGANSYYQHPPIIGGRPPSRSEVTGLTPRSANDVISSEIEKSVASGMPSRSIDETNVRSRDYSGFSSHISEEGSHSSHGQPKMAHSNPVTSRVPQFVPGSSGPSSMPTRGGAPSMARMSQVIEDSIRGHMGEPTSAPPMRGQPKVELPPGPVEKDLGGLACPRTKSPPGVGSSYRRDESNHTLQQRGPRLIADVSGRRENQMSMDYPTMEIPQSSRFGLEASPFHQHQGLPFHEKRNIIERHTQPGSGVPPHPSPTSQQSGPPPPSHGDHRKAYGDPWQAHNSGSGKPSHPPEAHSGSPSLLYRFDASTYPPPSHSASRDLGRTQDVRDPPQNPLPPRKRMTPPQHNHPNPHHHTQLPLKKQTLEVSGIHPDAFGRAREQMQQNPHHQSVPSRHQSIAQNMSPSSKYSIPSYPHPHRPHGLPQSADPNNELIQHYASQRSEVTITPTPPPTSKPQSASHTLPQMSIPQFAPDLAIAAATSAPNKDKERQYETSSGAVSSSSAWRGDTSYGNGARPHISSSMTHQSPNIPPHYGHLQRPHSPGPIPPPQRQPHPTHQSQYRRIVLPMMPTSSSSIAQAPSKMFRGGHDLDEQSNKKWQEEISTGFDRLVAYATEVDKRRKSCDSNSPGFDQSLATQTPPNDGNSPLNAATPEGNRPSTTDIVNRSGGSNEETDQFVDNRVSTLSMKFKRAPNYQRYPGPPLRSPTSSQSSGSRHFAASSIPMDHDLISPPPNIDNNSATRASLIASSRGPLPGENLPQHHFKKRYFAEHIETPNSGRVKDFHEGHVSSSPLSPKKRLSMLGSKASPHIEASSSYGQQFSRLDEGEVNRNTPDRFRHDERSETAASKTVTKKDVEGREVSNRNPATESTNSKETHKATPSVREKCSNLSEKPKS